MGRCCYVVRLMLVSLRFDARVATAISCGLPLRPYSPLVVPSRHGEPLHPAFGSWVPHARRDAPGGSQLRQTSIVIVINVVQCAAAVPPPEGQ